MLRRAGLILAGSLLFFYCVYLFFPAARLNDALGRVLSAQGLSLSPPGEKCVLPGMRWRDASLNSGTGVLLRCDELTIRPLLIPLFTGRAIVGATAVMGNGRVSARYGMAGREGFSIEADGLRLDTLPFFQTVLGAKASGALMCKGELQRSRKGMEGELRLEVRQLGLSGTKLGAFMLPDVSGLTAQGVARMKDGHSRLDSFTLEGEGIYMRLSGVLPASPAAPLDLSLEIMPKPEFMESQRLVFLLLARFMVSPGVYRIPVKGTLLQPEIL